MALTTLNLANRVLEKLLVVGAGQSGEDEDVEKVTNTIPQVFATLETDGTYTVADADDIDSSAFEWLAIIVGFYNATDFGKAPDAQALEYAEFRLKKLVAAQPTYQPLTHEYI